LKTPIKGNRYHKLPITDDNEYLNENIGSNYSNSLGNMITFNSNNHHRNRKSEDATSVKYTK